MVLNLIGKGEKNENEDEKKEVNRDKGIRLLFWYPPHILGVIKKTQIYSPIHLLFERIVIFLMTPKMWGGYQNRGLIR